MKKVKDLPPIFFANIVWMTRYDGMEPIKKTNFAYVNKNNDAGEKFNFRVKGDEVHGYVQCNKNGEINLEKISRRYNCKIHATEKNRYIDGAIVVFFSRHEKGGARIVGFYLNARIYEKYELDMEGNIFNFACAKQDAFLIPEGQRDFEIPKVLNGNHTYGQDPRWYADTPECLPMVEGVFEYITKFSKDLELDRHEEEQINQINEVVDDTVKTTFDATKLTNEMPTSEHADLSPPKTYGTSAILTRKLQSGRRAEKYFIDFLCSLGLKQDRDFMDVSNDKNYGYDIQLGSEIGLEVKNILRGRFYLTDTEIAFLKDGKTHLIFVAEGKGIWLLKNTSKILNEIIKNIEEIKENTIKMYDDLEVENIKILITPQLKVEAILISNLSYKNFLEIFS